MYPSIVDFTRRHMACPSIPSLLSTFHLIFLYRCFFSAVFFQLFFFATFLYHCFYLPVFPMFFILGLLSLFFLLFFFAVFFCCPPS